ncbi:serine hydrolase, partial [Candidatus Sumerlaeota bacterium]|nr:serine hydrolase [Candidatus Sumerlaeota bacterium]
MRERTTKNRILFSLWVCLWAFPSAFAQTAPSASLYFPPNEGKWRENTGERPALPYFPPNAGNWEQVAPVSVGWNAGKLNEALQIAAKSRSSGVVILHRGRIMAEQYWNLSQNRYHVGKDRAGHAIEDVASAQKSVSAILVGIAQHKGLLSIGDSVQKYLGPGWSKASREQEKAITIRHLLTMTSGLTNALAYEAPPGTRWLYNTTCYARTIEAVAAAAKKSPNELTREWLTGPLGMSDSRWVDRPGPVSRLNPRGFATTARDLARFGLLILAGGKWNGETVIADREYLRAALSPSQKLNPSYGYLWWVNARQTRFPGAPADMVAALGAGEHD